MKWQLSVDELLALLGTDTVLGQYGGAVTGMADLRSAGKGELSFFSSRRFAKHMESAEASVILVPNDHEGEPKKDQLWIKVESPSIALATVCRHLEMKILPRPPAGIHPTAIIDASAQVDPSASIGPYCIIHAHAIIGPGVFLQSSVCVEQGASVDENSILHHGVTLGWGCSVGKNSRLFPGAVIGGDGFGYNSDKSGHHRVPQIGIVVIEDDVEIGGNACIDRARFAATRIGQGTKVDNLVQIGHNVIIGKHCIICALVGISGSAELGDFVVLAGQVGVNGHIKIGSGVTATGQSGISKDVAPGTILSGTPARSHREEMRRHILLKQLPEFSRRLKILEEG